jgi:hypothetical protein
VTIEPLLEPCHRVLLLDVALEADAFLLPPSGDTGPRTIHHDVEVHTEDTNAGVVSCTEINVLLHAEAKVAGLGEVSVTELVLLDLETTLKNLL